MRPEAIRSPSQPVLQILPQLLEPWLSLCLSARFASASRVTIQFLMSLASQLLLKESDQEPGVSLLPSSRLARSVVDGRPHPMSALPPSEERLLGLAVFGPEGGEVLPNPAQWRPVRPAKALADSVGIHSFISCDRFRFTE